MSSTLNYGSVNRLSPDEPDEPDDDATIQFPSHHHLDTHGVSRSRRRQSFDSSSPLSRRGDLVGEYSEEDPFLPRPSRSTSLSTSSTLTTQPPRRKVSSLWLVPVVILAGISRGMTMAPRIEVYTQIACDEIHPVVSPSHSNSTTPLSLPIALRGFQTISSMSDPSIPLASLHTSSLMYTNYNTASEKEISVAAPSQECLRDPAVQSRAAGIQATLSTIVGVLSIITAGYWGQISDAFGRKAALSGVLFGMTFHDVIYILVSIPNSVFNRHAWAFLIVGPLVEGLLGSMPALHAAQNAFLADSAQPGSRSTVFAYFQGATYISLAAGPQIAGILLKVTNMDARTTMFYSGLAFSIIVFCYVLLILPETVTPESMYTARHPVHNTDSDSREEMKTKEKLVLRVREARHRLLAPLTIFGPKRKPGGGWDLNMTFLVIAQFTHLMSVGVVQVKFLYAQHTFAWSVKQLSYYISFLWVLRAFHLLLLLPTILRFIKPKAPRHGTPAGKRQALSQDMKFDYGIAQASIFLDTMSYVLTLIAPASSQMLFVGFTSLSSFTAGVNPAIHSLAVSYLYASSENANVGQMFGGMSMLQAVSHTLQPLVFGMVYSKTVATYPKAIFALAAGLLFSSSAMFTLLRTNVTPHRGTDDSIPRGGPVGFDEEHDPRGERGESSLPLLAEERGSG